MLSCLLQLLLQGCCFSIQQELLSGPGQLTREAEPFDIKATANALIGLCGPAQLLAVDLHVSRYFTNPSWWVYKSKSAKSLGSKWVKRAMCKQNVIVCSIYQTDCREEINTAFKSMGVSMYVCPVELKLASKIPHPGDMKKMNIS